MPVTAKATGGTFELCPPGTHPAVCVDVIDLGEQETPFIDEKTGKKKVQHQVQIIWLVAAEDEEGEPVLREDGEPHRLGKFYNLSLNELASLRKDLDRWRGVPFTEEELAEGFDVERVIGQQCQIHVIHRQTAKGDTRAYVETVLPKGRRDPVIEPSEYIREMDRPGGRDTRSPAAKEGRGDFPEGGRRTPQERERDEIPLPF